MKLRATILVLCLTGSPAVAAAAEADATPAPQPSPSGMRDPFRPFTLAVRAKAKEAPKTPLEQYDLGALKLVAIIYDTAAPKAMVEDNAGLGFSVGIGTRIGNGGGVVKSIAPDQVVVEEEIVDFYGEKKKSEIVLRLKPEGEKRP